MKVICIDEISKNKNFGGIKFKIGDEATVLEFISFAADMGFYRFEEDGGDFRYNSSRFIPLSTISETEMNRNYQTVKQ